MDLNNDKLDAAALAILSLTLHDGRRVWKGIDWTITERLFENGLIENPVGRTKSLVLTDEGLAEAAAVLTSMFGKTQISRCACNLWKGIRAALCTAGKPVASFLPLIDIPGSFRSLIRPRDAAPQLLHFCHSCIVQHFRKANDGDAEQTVVGYTCTNDRLSDSTVLSWKSPCQKIWRFGFPILDTAFGQRVALDEIAATLIGVFVDLRQPMHSSSLSTRKRSRPNAANFGSRG